MLTLAAFEPNGYAMIMAGMVAVLIMIGVVCTYAWFDSKQKAVFKLHKEREQTHREIAAYVAEGSITPADAENMLRAMGSVATAEDLTHAKRGFNPHPMKA